MDSSLQEPVMPREEGIHKEHRIRAVALEGNRGAMVASLADIKARVHTGNQLNKVELGVMAKRNEAVMRIALKLLHHKPMASKEPQMQEQATVHQLDRTTSSNQQDINNSPTITEPVAMVANNQE